MQFRGLLSRAVGASERNGREYAFEHPSDEPFRRLDALRARELVDGLVERGRVEDRPGVFLVLPGWCGDGRILAANLRRELMTRDELMAQLRKQGIEDVGQVKGAWIEADGSVSVIRCRSG